jgi:ankyrin repeat protein
MDAVKHGEIMKVRKYLSWHFNPNYSQDGSTPLILAVKNDHAEVAKLLISHGANTNTIDEQGHTPLHWAYFKGNKELIEALLQNKDPKEIQTGTPPITPS